MSAVPGSIAALFRVLLKLFYLAWHRWNHRNLCLADCITTFGLAQMEPQELVPYRRYRALGAVYASRNNSRKVEKVSLEPSSVESFLYLSCSSGIRAAYILGAFDDVLETQGHVSGAGLSSFRRGFL